MIIFKKCNKCGLEKIINDFHKSKDGKYGVRAICKDCIRQCDRDFYQKNKEKILPIKNEKQKIYYQKNIEARREYGKKYHEKHKILKGRPQKKIKEIKIKKIPKSRSELWKEWYEKNKNILMFKTKERRKKDELFKLKDNFRRRVKHAIYGNTKNFKSLDLLGINIEDYKEYLECLFDENMNWFNYGKEWVIDHVIPVSFFNIKNKKQLYMAFNFKNTRPLNIKENLSKGNRSISNLYDILGIDLMVKNLSIER